jgi:hypothetical protein
MKVQMRLNRCAFVIAVAIASAGIDRPCGADVADAIAAIQAIGPRGEGQEAAVAAAEELQSADASALIEILNALNTANPLATNWLMISFESIADRTLKSRSEFPLDDVRAYFDNHDNNPAARRIAYKWIVTVEPGLAAEIIPESLDDPSSEMRRDAVALLIQTATEMRANNQTDEAIATFQQALTGATDDDQVRAIVGPLEELGHDVDVTRHFGFLTDWTLVGPFDNTGMGGFDVPYGPELNLDLSAEYEGKLGAVTWTPFSTQDEYGIFDIAGFTEPHKGAITYAYTEFESAAEQPVQFRLASWNAWKLWVNGELLFAREEYHRGMWFDQYIVEGTLKPGVNQILLKVCQNEQTEEWAQSWQFQFRVCDQTGRAVHPVETAVSAIE